MSLSPVNQGKFRSSQPEAQRWDPDPEHPGLTLSPRHPGLWQPEWPGGGRGGGVKVRVVFTASGQAVLP